MTYDMCMGCLVCVCLSNGRVGPQAPEGALQNTSLHLYHKSCFVMDTTQENYGAQTPKAKSLHSFHRDALGISAKFGPYVQSRESDANWGAGFSGRQLECIDLNYSFLQAGPSISQTRRWIMKLCAASLIFIR